MLKLEKRLDENLTYLRDAPLEHSTFPFDMEPTPHPKGAPIPINPIKVRTYCVQQLKWIGCHISKLEEFWDTTQNSFVNIDYLNVF